MKLTQANQVALDHCESIEAHIEKLSKIVAGRKALALENQIVDWGIVGDLGRINGHLAEISNISES